MISAPELTPTVLSLTLALLALAGTTDGAITCEAVTTRYESIVTCFFGTDIFDTKHSFNLQFHYPNLQADPERPLMCNWVTAEDMDCKESQGVVYDHVLADQITVKGPPDLGRVGGKYVCQVLPPLGVPVKPCNLTFRDVTTTTTTTTTQSNALEDLRDKVSTTLILCGLVLTVALIILIAVLFIVCSRVELAERIRKWRKKKEDGEKPQETADPGGIEKPPEREPLLHAEVACQVTGENGKEEDFLLHRAEKPGPSSFETGSPEDSRTAETQPAGEEGDRAPEPEDVQPEVTQPEEANPQPKKKKKFWWRSSSSTPKAPPGDQNSPGTGDPPEVTTGVEVRSSNKGKKKSSKTKDVKGEGAKESPGNEETRQAASTADGSEEPRR